MIDSSGLLDFIRPAADTDRMLIDRHADVSLLCELAWRCENGVHTDYRFLQDLNLWQDLFPPQLESALAGRSVGDRVTIDFMLGIPTCRRSGMNGRRPRPVRRPLPGRGATRGSPGSYPGAGHPEGILGPPDDSTSDDGEMTCAGPGAGVGRDRVVAARRRGASSGRALRFRGSEPRGAPRLGDRA